MKSFCFVLLPMLLIGTMNSCNNSGHNKHSDFFKLTNNLYAVNYSDYDENYALRPGKGNNEWQNSNSKPFGCSGVAKGAFMGRNFDFVFGNYAVVVLRTDHTENHFASLATVSGLFALTPAAIDKGLDKDLEALIPNILTDGINEKGVAVEINCVTAEDAGGLAPHTNPGKVEVAQDAVVRYLLDRATSADHAIELLKNIDIVHGPRDVFGLHQKQHEVHFLISDANRKYVVELDNLNGGEMVVIEDGHFITNFYLHQWREETPGNFPEHSMGVERFLHIRDKYDEMETSVDGIKKVMEDIRYTHSNLTKESQTGYYRTCYSDHPMTAKDGTKINWGNHLNYTNEIEDQMEKDRINIEKAMKDPAKKNPNNLWNTIHTSIYDIENKTLDLAIHENYNEYYHFEL